MPPDGRQEGRTRGGYLPRVKVDEEVQLRRGAGGKATMPFPLSFFLFWLSMSFLAPFFSPLLLVVLCLHPVYRLAIRKERNGRSCEAETASSRWDTLGLCFDCCAIYASSMRRSGSWNVFTYLYTYKYIYIYTLIYQDILEVYSGDLWRKVHSTTHKMAMAMAIANSAANALRTPPRVLYVTDRHTMHTLPHTYIGIQHTTLGSGFFLCRQPLSALVNCPAREARKQRKPASN